MGKSNSIFNAPQKHYTQNRNEIDAWELILIVK